jgi:hypothetical protein
MNAYKLVIRHLVPDYRRVGLDMLPISYAQLSVILRYHDHIQVEVADEISESVLATLADSNSFAGLYDSRQEALGYLLHAALINRARRAIRLDLDTTMADMQDEEAVDREFEREAV